MMQTLSTAGRTATTKAWTASAAGVLGATVVLGTVVAPAQPAFAAVRDGKCHAGEFCYYYESSQKGSVSDFRSSVGDYGSKQPSCYEFRGAGEGKGRCIKNNAESIWNRSSKTVRVYFNTGYRGASQDVRPGAKVNLNGRLKNENASHTFLSSKPPVAGCKTDGTNSKLPTTILVYRVRTGKVDRVAFKTYVKDVLPNEWVRSWPKASLDAGAMAVKSYGWYWALNSTRRTPAGTCYDVRDDTSDQVYRPGSAAAATSAAVDRTWGTRMTRNGRVLRAHYCATATACPGWVPGDWMSQQGSRAEAAAGKSYRAILHKYYRTIRLTS